MSNKLELDVQKYIISRPRWRLVAVLNNNYEF